MRNPLTSKYLGTTALVLVLCLFGCGGSSSQSSNVTPPPESPSITGLSPSSGVVGASVTITGSNFGSTPGTVTFAGTTASVVSWTDSSIVAKVPSGATTGNVVVTVDGSASNGVNFTVVALSAGSITANYFGMQCGNGDTQDCEGSNPLDIVWPSSQAQPGLLRLHDAGTYWSILNPSSGTYNWASLDAWLDLIAQHQPVSVMQVFTWTPCWDTTTGTCGIAATAPTGSNGVPTDLTTSGSPSFNAFVQAFVQHCTAAGNCVGNCPASTTCATTNLIQYYEMWNEWDLTFHWVGTMAQVYQMVAPAAAIIKQNVSNAVILTPSATKESSTWQCDLLNWLNYETANGVISDWIAWHVYLSENATTDVIPEVQWTTYNQGFLAVQQGQSVSGCSSGSSAPGWSKTPYANTETNFNGAKDSTYTCPSSQYNAQDCIGQIIRWQIMHDSNGASSLDWYKWNETIGSNSQMEPAYYWMMQKFVGGKFTGAASSSLSGASEVWSAPFTESDGSSAMFVWTTSEAGVTYSVPTGFSNYEDLSGNMTSVSAGSTVNVTTEPILLQQ